MEFTNKNKLRHTETESGKIAAIVLNTILYKIYRSVMISLSIVFLIWFMIPIFFNIINVGNILGIIICICVFCFYSFRGVFLLLKTAAYSKKASKIVWKIFKALIYCFISYGIIISTIMIICANIKPQDNATAVVLGAQVKPWGPSTILNDRIIAAEKYLVQNPNAVCVASGGQGNDEHISEAKCIKDTMISNGVDPSRIYIEDKSTSTKENIEYSMKIIEKNKLNKNLAIVSDGFHQARARLIAYKLGLYSNIYALNANTDIRFAPTYFVREWVALPFELLFR